MKTQCVLSLFVFCRGGEPLENSALLQIGNLDFVDLAAAAAVVPGANDSLSGVNSDVLAFNFGIDKCTDIYLDAGANRGVQVRKLYEPEKYPKAAMLSTFDEAFGNALARRSSSGLCALGFEPNPVHQARLTEVETAYLEQGWQVHFYPVAIWKSAGSLQFDVKHDPGHSDWGSRLSFAEVGRKIVDVPTIDFDAFIRKLPRNSIRLLKMDVEGAEYETLAKMLQSGTLCKDIVEKISIEVHPWGDVDSWRGERTFEEIQRRVGSESQQAACAPRGGPTEIIFVDDESYLLDGQGLPL